MSAARPGTGRRKQAPRNTGPVLRTTGRLNRPMSTASGIRPSPVHIASDVAFLPQAIALLNEVGFPDDLVVNTEWNRSREFLGPKER